jgi:hypothetical protein
MWRVGGVVGCGRGRWSYPKFEEFSCGSANSAGGTAPVRALDSTPLHAVTTGGMDYPARCLAGWYCKVPNRVPEEPSIGTPIEVPGLECEEHARDRYGGCFASSARRIVHTVRIDGSKYS